MLRLIVLAIVLLLIPAEGEAQLTQTHAGGAPGSTYVGPGDTVSGAKLLFGLRGMTAAYSTGSNPAITVRRASDNTTENINILSSGSLDITTANTFAGTDATATCTIATTTATCTGASSTPHVGSTITGAGLTEPCFASAVGTFTGGAGTVTVSNGGGSTPCGTISSGETLTFQYGLYVTAIFDQSGNGNICFNGSSDVACTATQATQADQPQLMPLCPTKPCLRGLTNSILASQEVINGSALPITSYSTYSRTGTGGSYGTVLKWANGFAMGSSTNAGNAYCYNAGALQDFAMTDNTFHVVQVVFNSTASTTVGSVDGVDVSTTLNPGTGSQANGQIFNLLNDGASNDWFNGFWYEGGLWFTGFSSGQRTSLCHNARLYWGTGGSC